MRATGQTVKIEVVAMESAMSGSRQQSKQHEMRLVPHSGIQFINFKIDLDKCRNVSRQFLGRPDYGVQHPDGSVKLDLLPTWNEDDPDADPPFQDQPDDIACNATTERAAEIFLDQWVPIPYLAVRPGLDEMGREILEPGPVNWARVKITLRPPNDPAKYSHNVVFAFDTEIVDRTPKLYAGPSREDVGVEQLFAFAHSLRDVAPFMKGAQSKVARSDSAGESSEVDVKQKSTAGVETSQGAWISAWLKEIWTNWREANTGRRLKDEEKRTVDHVANYIVLLESLATAIPDLPRIRLVDTYSEERRIKPVQVDLVLDIGNSRTCGILIETYPNDRETSFGNSTKFGLRDLGDPSQELYREPFESHIELKQADFGPIKFSKQTRVRAFFWPSPVRTGPEAARYRDMSEGTEGTSGMSSPKRYLCDVAPVNQEWRFQAQDYGANGDRPPVDLAVRQFLNFAGDVLRQVTGGPAGDGQLYKTLAKSVGYEAKLEEMARERKYSRSSMFTFMMCEIIAQAISMINNPQFRASRRERDAPRVLRRIIMSIPTAMPIKEQQIMRSRAEAATKLIWQMMKWDEKTRPEVAISWDEATCTQVVYLYNEIATKYGSNLKEFFDLVGKPRRRIDPEKVKDELDPNVEKEASLRVASVDVGGGTTDLMVTTYYLDDGKSLMPIQNFREGFRIAGDDILREVIQLTIIPQFENELRKAGISDPKSFLRDRFGGHDATMSIQEQKLRRQFVTRVFESAALAILKEAECADAKAEVRTEARTVREILVEKMPIKGRPRRANVRANEPSEVLKQHVADYVEKEAAVWGADEFRVEDVTIPMVSREVRNAVHAVLGDVFDCLSEAINSLDCDVVILSGRPTRLPATIDLFVDRLAVSPDRVIALSEYQVGDWYPFAGKASYRIEDPKTATVVGALLCSLVDRKITNFRIDTQRFSMRSTAKFIGEMDGVGRISDEHILFRWDNGEPTRTAKTIWHNPMLIGYRQLPLARWIATPLYRLKLNENASTDRMPRGPYRIVLERRNEIEDEKELQDRTDGPLSRRQTYGEAFASNEALKESITIAEVDTVSGNAGLRQTDFSLQLETLGLNEGYWLDTGILTVLGG